MTQKFIPKQYLVIGSHSSVAASPESSAPESYSITVTTYQYYKKKWLRPDSENPANAKK